MTAALLQSHIPGIPARRGKVRDVYEAGDELLLVATDRLSAFDVVLPTGIPGKGAILTALAAYWFGRLAPLGPHHFLGVIEANAPAPFDRHLDQLAGRTMRCRRAEVVPIECVVRGYLAGSGWSEYERVGRVCGVSLPPGLLLGSRLPHPIFTPATKAASGHDENISFEQAADSVGGETMAALRDRSLRLYEAAAAHAEWCGVIVADTKFEFGRSRGELLLIDEVLTPDSSRFWSADSWGPGGSPPGFDKQFVRDYLEGLVAAGKWDKSPPGPALPEEVVRGTQERYREALRRLTGDGD